MCGVLWNIILLISSMCSRIFILPAGYTALSHTAIRILTKTDVRPHTRVFSSHSIYSQGREAFQVVKETDASWGREGKAVNMNQACRYRQEESQSCFCSHDSSSTLRGASPWIYNYTKSIYSLHLIRFLTNQRWNISAICWWTGSRFTITIHAGFLDEISKD